MYSIRKQLARFRKEDQGTATVEAVLWLPIFVFIFGLMVDASMIFHNQTKVLRVVQDANRHYSIGRFDAAETETYIKDTLGGLKITPKTVKTTKSTNGVAHTRVVVSAAQLQMLGYFSALEGLEIQVLAQHLLENWEGTT